MATERELADGPKLIRLPFIEPMDAVDGRHLDVMARCLAAVENLEIDVTSLPIWAIQFQAKRDGIELVVDLRVADRNKGTLEWIHVWRAELCPWAPLEMNGPDHLIRFTRDTLASVMAHEVDESIKLAGVRVFDPHKPLLPAAASAA